MAEKEIQQKKIPQKIVLYPQDVANIIGKSQRTAQRLIDTIRAAFGDHGQNFVTVKELCIFCNMDEEAVQRFMSA